MNKLEKPKKWALDPGQVDPKWNWFWKHATCVMPFWQYAPGTQWFGKNYVRGKPAVTDNGGAAFGEGFWQASPYGMAYHFDRDLSRNAIIPGTFGEIAPSVDKGSALLVRVPSVVTQASPWGNDSESDPTRFGIYMPLSGDTSRWDWGSFSGVSHSFTLPESELYDGKPQIIAACAGPANGRRFYYRGRLVTQNTAALTHGITNSTPFLISGGPGDSEINDYYFFAYLDYEVTDAQARMWMADPYGPIRRRESPRVFVTPVGGAATVGALVNGGLVNAGLVNGGLVA